MPPRSQDPVRQFAAVEDLLAGWLRERRGVLARYTEMAVALQGPTDDDILARRQGALCEILVDYTSAGHFEIYHELIGEAESFGDGSGALAEKLLPAIGDTTEVILAYEEKYGSLPIQRRHLKRDLSALGEVLESRFALEDRMIAGLHGRHRAAVLRGA